MFPNSVTNASGVFEKPDLNEKNIETCAYIESSGLIYQQHVESKETILNLSDMSLTKSFYRIVFFYRSLNCKKY